MTALFCAVAMTLLLCSCGNGEDVTGQTTTLPVASESDPLTAYGVALTFAYAPGDSMNPYKCDGVLNRTLMPLIYDSLYTLDGSYTPVPVLAASANIDSLTLTVALNTSAVFSNGKALTSGDAVYSFSLAKASPAYSSQLLNIASATAVSPSQVEFKLLREDIYALNLLTFPIVPESSADSAESVPAGTGRYIHAELDSQKYLTLNTSSQRFRSTAVRNIMLCPVNENGAQVYLMRTKKIDFLLDSLSSGSYERISSSYTDAATNNMVYLGLNSITPSSVMTHQWVRRAVSAGINTSAIAQSAFLGHASAAYAPLNPDFYELKTDNPPSQSAADILDENGFSSFDSSGTLRTNGRNSLSLKLIVCKGNAFKESAAELIKSQLLACGISVRVAVLESADFLTALTEGNYDMYIGETALPYNMSLGAFCGGSTPLSYGIDIQALSELDDGFHSGTVSCEAFVNSFRELSPFVPLCFRKGVAYYSGGAGSVKALCCDAFANIHEWELPSAAE